MWSTTLWKNINSAELFNQFFYFPDDEYHTFGKKSLAYIIWDAMAAGEIPIYEDDDLLIPIDNEAFVERYTRPDTIQLEIGYDEDDNELYETIIRPKYFDGSEIYSYAFRGGMVHRQTRHPPGFTPHRPGTSQGDLPRTPNGEDHITWASSPLLDTHAASCRPQPSGTLHRLCRPQQHGQPALLGLGLPQPALYRLHHPRVQPLQPQHQQDTSPARMPSSKPTIIEDKVFEIENDMWEY